MRSVSVLLIIFLILSIANGLRTLSATSLVNCMANSQIDPSYFNVTFNPEDSSIRYSLDLQTSLNTYVIADVLVYAYGFEIIHEKIDLCDLGWKQFCPIFPGNLQIESIQTISKKYTDMIPGIAYQVPNIDAVVKVHVYDRDSGESLSCIQTDFTNGKTVSQPGVKWATAVIAGLGLLIAAVMSTFGNSNAASHIAANAVSLFLYFQSVVVVSMQSVERMPPIASAWAENLAWSMGLIRVEFMQKVFRWYVQATGGTPTVYFIASEKQILVQRALSYFRTLHNFVRRSLDYALNSTDKLIVLRGIKRIGYNSGIEPTSIVVTGFTFFIIIGYVLVALLVFFKAIVTLLARSGKLKSHPFIFFRTSFPVILKGSVLRYIYIGFTQLIILSLWQFTVQDSPAVIVLAVIFFSFPLTLLVFAYYKVWFFGKLSVKKFGNPAALLYGDSRLLNKYGFCYTMFHADKYWFGIVLVAYNLVKGIFIGLCQNSGKVSSLVLFFLDLAYTIYLIISKPYLNNPTNILNYLISVVATINSFLFVFFSGVFNQTAPVASIMGWVFFILNAAFSLILLIMILVFIGLSLISKNPDARFAPAKDDRFSFQTKGPNGKYNQHVSVEKHDEKSSASSLNEFPDEVPNTELTALGIAAKDHTNNWETEMFKLNNLSEAPADNIFTPSLEQTANFEPEHKENFGSRLKGKLTRGLSLKGKEPKRNDSKIEKGPIRISDTLSVDEEADLLANLKDNSSGSESPKFHFRSESRDSSKYSISNSQSIANPRGFV